MLTHMYYNWKYQSQCEKLYLMACPLKTLLSLHCLTHCILNRLSNTLYWKSPISVLSMSGYKIYIFLKKNG